jgi:hypothetical protein
MSRSKWKTPILKTGQTLAEQYAGLEVNLIVRNERVGRDATAKNTEVATLAIIRQAVWTVASGVMEFHIEVPGWAAHRTHGIAHRMVVRGDRLVFTSGYRPGSPT